MRFLRTAAGMLAAGLVAGLGTVAAGPTPGGFTSTDVEWLSYVPFDIGTATGLTVRNDLAFVTSWRAVSVYDIKDVRNPQLLSTVPFGFRFENEDVSGNDELLLFAESLPGDTLWIYDITDPSNPVEIAGIDGAGDHTTQCILDCTWTMGSDGSVVYLGGTVESVKADARLIRQCPEGAVYDEVGNCVLDGEVVEGGAELDWRKLVGLRGSNHDVELIQQDLVMTTPISDDFQVLDVSNPLDPVVLGRGKHPNPGPWLFHSGEWFREGQDRWILQQGEDNFNPQCGEGNGPIVLFDVLKSPIGEDGELAKGTLEQGRKATEAFFNAEGDPELEAEATLKYPIQTQLTDTYAVGNGVYADGSPAVNALGCSAHWFDDQPDFRDGGLVAVGYYEHGTRFLEVTGDGRLLERGWFLPHGGSTSAAYWLDERTVWAVDYTRGIDILEWTGEIVDGYGRVAKASDEG